MAIKIFFLHLTKIVIVLLGTLSSGIAQYLPELNKYICYKSTDKININGKLDEHSWSKAAFSSLFIDIEGSKMPNPLYETRVKMLWDDEYFYIGAWLEEPHLWATYTERDAVIFHENDFEIFIDPTGDTHNYVEIEINALNTVWDLILTKPYRDHGKAVTSWNMDGLLTSVGRFGTINDPADIDSCWTIEFALPWKDLLEFTDHGRKPIDGEQWKINFSRVQWQLEINDGRYIKKINPETNKPYAEYNWVWSPQGVIDMHQPETWGMVQFSEIEVGKGQAEFIIDVSENCKWELRKLYDAQRKYFSDFQRYSYDLNDLQDQLELQLDNAIEIWENDDDYIGIINCDQTDQQWRIRSDGFVWSE